MREIRTGIEIAAPPESVWEVLTDVDSYEEWNPHITHVSGDLRTGASLEIAVDRIDASSRTLTVRVSTIDPPRKLQWIGTLGSKWLFQGTHTFELQELDSDRTQFVNHERLTGVLVPFVVSDDPRRDYVRMNEALKDRVEHHTSPDSDT